MRRIAFVFIISLIAAFRSSMAMNSDIIITASDVTSASDIEQAIQEATGYGTHSGTVLLDASDGPFVFTQPDRTINIASSDIRLRSVNGAEIANCDDAIFFDEFITNDVIIDGITFHCSTSGIIAGWGTHERVTLRNNVIETTMMGIEVNGGNGWVITDNRVSAGVDAINLKGIGGTLIANNTLSGNEIAIFLDLAHGNKLLNNNLASSWQGVLLIYGTNDNRIMGNNISGPRQSGVSFEGDSQGNIVHGNNTTCALEASCLAVSGPPQIFVDNQISGNNVR